MTMTGMRWSALATMLLFAATLWSQDLLYERTDGRTMTLDSLPDSRMTLLLFYDPECSDCQQELFVMRHSSQLRQAIAEARMQVLAVCTEPNDSLWRHTVSEMPLRPLVAPGHVSAGKRPQDRAQRHRPL